jgi:translation initiation factor 1 (eIF-1/SUI1)
LDDDDYTLVTYLLSSFRQPKVTCGSGETAKDGEYEAQGNHVATVMAARVLLGYAVKRSGD